MLLTLGGGCQGLMEWPPSALDNGPLLSEIGKRIITTKYLRIYCVQSVD